MKVALISTLITAAIVFVALVVREALMKRGMDPIGRLADTLAPIRPPNPPPTTPTTPTP